MDKPLAKITRQRRQKTQIDKIEDDKGDMTTNTNETQRIIGEYFESLYSSKLGNLEEIDKFLYICITKPKLNHEDINHLNISITSDENEAAIKSLPTKKRPEPGGFTSEFYQNCEDELIQFLLKLLQEIQREGTRPKSLYEARIILIPNPIKMVQKKSVTDQNL
jgi:hypothetical protein